MVKGQQAQLSERQLYTGLADMNVVAINPSQEELGKLLGRDNVKEPIYEGISKSDSNIATIRLDVWLKSKELDIVTKLSIFLENDIRTDKDNIKTQFINNTGKTAWAKAAEDFTADGAKDYKWFKPPFRPSYKGEESLYELLVALSNIDTTKADSEIKLDTPISDLIGGKLEELDNVVKTFANNKVRVLLGVKSTDGKLYQDVYGKVILRGGSTYINKLKEQLKGYAWNSDYQNSFTLQKYDTLAAASDTQTTKATSTTSNKQGVANLLSGI